MYCAECIKAFELIELPDDSSHEQIKSARKDWGKNLHPDIWQNKPGSKGAAKQLTNVNVAIDHLLACDGGAAQQEAQEAITRQDEIDRIVAEEYARTMQWVANHFAEKRKAAAREPDVLDTVFGKIIGFIITVFCVVVFGGIAVVIVCALGNSFGWLIGGVIGSVFAIIGIPCVLYGFAVLCTSSK